MNTRKTQWNDKCQEIHQMIQKLNNMLLNSLSWYIWFSQIKISSPKTEMISYKLLYLYELCGGYK